MSNIYMFHFLSHTVNHFKGGKAIKCIKNKDYINNTIKSIQIVLKKKKTIQIEIIIIQRVSLDIPHKYALPHHRQVLHH